MAVYKVTISGSYWTHTTSAFYYNSSTKKFYSDSTGTESEITSIVPPTRECFKFTGIRASTSYTSALYIDENGQFTDNLKNLSITAAKTIYVQGTQISYKLTLNGNGGSETFYVYVASGETGADRYYSDDLLTSRISTFPCSTRSSYVFSGYYSSTSGGTKWTDENGTPNNTFNSKAAASLNMYAVWVSPKTVTLSSTGWSGATENVYVDNLHYKAYSDKSLTTEINSVNVPTKECYVFDGYTKTNSETGILMIGSDGALTDNFFANVTNNVTIYAQGNRYSFKITFDNASGTGGASPIYQRNGVAGVFYSDADCHSAVTSVKLPKRSGYTFAGYFSANTGGYKYITSVGSFATYLRELVLTGDATSYAQWVANSYTLTFNYGIGTGSTEYKTVSTDNIIGTLPTATSARGNFVGWTIDGVSITSSTVWNFLTDKTAIAVWETHFGKVTDWFGLANDKLVPISSNSGDNKQRVCVSNATWSGTTQTGGAGKYDTSVNETGPVWRNPTVTYEIIGDVALSVKLGKGFAAVSSAGKITVSGYMITSASVDTKIGKFPSLTVSAVANEGFEVRGGARNVKATDAINTFTLSLQVAGRARAQNLMNAINGGGLLQACKLTASCTPVVLVDCLLPCASDVVNGTINVEAETCAASGEGAPTAGNGFTEVGSPEDCGGTKYAAWSFRAQKEMS